MIMMLRMQLDRLLQIATGASNFQRIHERASCAIWGKLSFVDIGFDSHGLIDEISRGGMRFRPSQSYICARIGDPVRVHAGRFDLAATIVNTTEYGYGLKFKTPLSPQDIEAFMAIIDHDDLAA